MSSQASELAEFTAKIALLEEAKRKKDDEATEWQQKVQDTSSTILHSKISESRLDLFNFRCSVINSSCLSLLTPWQALSAQDDLEKAKEELKTVATLVPAPPGGNAENEHDEQDENHAEASAELSNEGVSQLDLRSEEARVTEAQKNERVKQQLQVRVGGWRALMGVNGGRWVWRVKCYVFVGGLYQNVLW